MSSLAGLPDNVQRIDWSTFAVLPSGFTREPFGQSALATATHDGSEAIQYDAAKPFIAYSERFLNVTGRSPSLKVLSRKDYAFAHEAGVYDKAHDAVWVTSNLLDPTVHGSKVQLHRIDLQSGEATLIETSSIAAANGACALDDGVLLCDQGSATEPSQLVLVDFASHSARPVLNNFHGRHFNSLNDVIVLPAKGSEPSTSSTPGATVWFTDPPYGHEQSFRPQPQLPPHVYVWTLQTGAVRVAADGFQHPNGIAFSPDGKICYVTDTSHIHGTGQLNPALQSTIAHEPHPAIGLAKKRVFAFADCGVPDGIKCDVQGNVYSGCGDGLHVWDNEGTLLGKIVLGLYDGNMGAGCANFCFCPGGRIACFAEDRVYLVEGWGVEGDSTRCL